MSDGGGGTTVTNTYDPAYNDRMASIAEAQQNMAQQYFDYWNTTYKPMETAQVNANLALIPKQTDLQLSQIAMEKDLMPQTKDATLAKLLSDTATGKLTAAQATDALTLLPQQTELARKTMGAKDAALDLAMQGVDGRVASDQAQADVAQAFGRAGQDATLALSRRLVSPGGPSLAAAIQSSALEQAKAIAGARTQARNDARNSSFAMLSKVTGSA